MPKYTVIYNPLSDNRMGEKDAKRLKNLKPDDDLDFISITDITDYKAFFSSFAPDANFIIAGGDGTLNCFVNNMLDAGLEYPQNLSYFPAGSGNDFFKDIGAKFEDAPVSLKGYLDDLPEIEVNGIRRKFINGIGYGIDGYVCEVGDRHRQKSDKKVNYTLIALRGLIGGYKPRNAKVVIDGVEHEYKKVWLAPSMNGRYFGGGMMVTPDQDRLNKDRKITFMCFYGAGRLNTLLKFPKIFSGAHKYFKKHLVMVEAYDISIEFDVPCALQIDGDTIRDVKKCHCTSSKINIEK